MRSGIRRLLTGRPRPAEVPVTGQGEASRDPLVEVQFWYSFLNHDARAMELLRVYATARLNISLVDQGMSAFAAFLDAVLHNGGAYEKSLGAFALSAVEPTLPGIDLRSLSDFFLTSIDTALNAALGAIRIADTSGEQPPLDWALSTIRFVTLLISNTRTHNLPVMAEFVLRIIKFGGSLLHGLSDCIRHNRVDSLHAKFIVAALLQLAEIAQLTFDPEQTWRKYLVQWKFEPTDAPTDGSLLARTEKVVEELVDTLVQLLSALQTEAPRGTVIASPLLYKLQAELLHCTGALLLDDPATHTRFWRRGGLDILFAIIRWPPFLISSDGELALNRIPQMSTALQCEFRNQLLTWHVIFVASANDRFEASQALSARRQNHMTSFFLWVSLVGPTGFNSQPGTYDGLDDFPLCPTLLPQAADDEDEEEVDTPSAAQRPPEVEFPLDASRKGGMPVGNPVVPVVKGISHHVELDMLYRMAISCIIWTIEQPEGVDFNDRAVLPVEEQVFMVFNSEDTSVPANVKARAALCADACVPQFLFIQFFCTILIQGEEHRMRISNNDTLFKILLSPAFLRWSNADPQKSRENALLRRNALSFVAYVLAMPEIDISFVLARLFLALEQNRENIQAVLELCQCIRNVLLAKPDQGRSMLLLGSFAGRPPILGLASILAKQLRQTDDAQSSVFHRAHWCALSTLSVFLEGDVSSPVHLFVATQPALLDLLCGQLFDTQPLVAQFALSRLLYVLTCMGAGGHAGQTRGVLAHVLSFIAERQADGEGMDVVQRKILHEITEQLWKSSASILDAFAPTVARTFATVRAAISPQEAMQRIIQALLGLMATPGDRCKTCEAALACLSSLCASSPDFCAHVVSNDGLSRIWIACVSQPNGEPWEGLVTAWCGLIVNAPYHVTARQTICIPSAAGELLRRMSDMPDALLDKTLGILTQMARASDINRMHLSAAGTITETLRLLAAAPTIVRVRHVLSLFQVVGSYAITPRELDASLALLKADESGNLPMYFNPLLGALSHMVMNAHDAPSAFHFGGKSSSMSFPTLDLGSLPGLTFMTWIRIDDMMRGGNEYRPRLFSLGNRDPSGDTFLDAFLHDGHLVLTLVKAGQRLAQARFSSFRFPLVRWIHVAVCFEGVQRRWAATNALLYIDGREVARKSIPFPSFVMQAAASRLGSTVFEAEGDEPRVTGTEPSFHGQFTSVYLLRSTVSSLHISHVHSLGPLYRGVFAPDEQYQYPKRLSSVFSGEVNESIFLLLSPNATRQDVAIDVAPATLAMARGADMTGLFEIPPKERFLSTVVNVHVSNHSSAATVIQSVGGMAVLFPIILLFDTPLHPLSSAMSVSVAFMDLLAALLLANNRNQVEFRRGRYAALLSHFFQQVSPQHYELSVPALSRVSSAIHPDAPDIALDIQKYLLRDPLLWIYNPSIQFHRTMITSLAAQLPSSRRHVENTGVLPVMHATTLLRMIDRFYWEVASGESCREGCVVGQMVFARPGEQERVAMRTFCYRLMDEEMSNSSSAFSEIAQFMYMADDPRMAFDVYSLVAEHIKQRSLDLIWNSILADVVLYMLDSPLDRNRALSVHLISMLLASPSVPERARKRFRLDEYGGFEVLRHIWRAQSNMTHEMADTLMELIIEKPLYDIKSMKRSQALVAVAGTTIANVSAVVLLLHLGVHAPEPFKEEIMSSLLMLCVQSESNLALLLGSPVVLLGLIRLLIDVRIADDAKGTERIVEHVSDLIARAVAQKAETDPEAWQLLEQVLILAVSHNLSQVLWFRHKLLLRVLQRIRPATTETKISPALSTNLLQTLLLTEEIVLLLAEGASSTEALRLADTVPESSKVALFMSAAAEGEAPNPNERALVFAALQTIEVMGGMGKEAFPSDVATKRPGGLQAITVRFALLLIRSDVFEHAALASSILRAVLESHVNPRGGLLARDDNEWKSKAFAIIAHLYDALQRAFEVYATPTVAPLASVFRAALRKFSALLPGLGSLDAITSDQSGPELLLSLFRTDAWISCYEQQLQPRLDDIRNQSKSLCEVAQRRIDKHAEKLLTHLRTHEARISQNGKRLKEAFKQVVKWNDNSMFDQTSSGHRRNVAKQFKTIMRQLATETSRWREETPAEEVHWMQDPTENMQGMRRKLRRNYEFTDHRDAAMRRDRVGVQSKAEQVDLYHFDRIGANVTEESDEEDQVDATPTAPDVLSAEVLSGDEALLFSTECELVALMATVKGRLEVTTRRLLFFVVDQQVLSDPRKVASLEAIDVNAVRDRMWVLADIAEVDYRLYLLRKSAVEIFFRDRTSVFYNLPSHEKQLAFMSHIRRLPLVRVGPRTPTEAFNKSQSVTSSWQRGELSNFEYLMHLNRISGRTYHDLTQYPVFPWVIADYTSPTLDLNADSTFRDLSKPVGALNETRLKLFLTRFDNYEDLSERKVPAFMYGTHYSTSASILFYMVRLEPFTTLSINLQSGRFDHADRLFHSIPETWINVLTNAADVKELTPEFFYLPEFLENTDRFDLGVRQNGQALDHVALPPWAATSRDFVRLNREALECERVSLQLHNWIDLIWGYKQRGPEAIKANNVFHHFTYEGSVNLDAIEDPLERSAIKAQIGNFGQTPSQLLRKPHPRRGDRNANVWDGINTLNSINVKADIRPSELPLMFTYYYRSGGYFVAFDESRTMIMLKARSSDVEVFMGEPRGISVALSSDAVSNASSFAASSDGRFVISCGFWDNSIRCFATDSLRQQFTLSTGHVQTVTCIALSEDDRVLVSGCRGRLVCVWDIETVTGGATTWPRLVLRGHHDVITTVAVNSSHDVVVSGSRDGMCHLYNTLTGQLMHRLNCSPSATIISFAVISGEGNAYVAAQSTKENGIEHSIYKFSVNGKVLGQLSLDIGFGRRAAPADKPSSSQPNALSQQSAQPSQRSVSSAAVTTATVLRAAFNTDQTSSAAGEAVSQLALSPDDSLLFVCCNDGRVRVFDTVKMAPPVQAESQRQSTIAMSLSSPVRSVAFSPSPSPRIVVSTASGTIRTMWSD